MVLGAYFALSSCNVLMIRAISSILAFGTKPFTSITSLGRNVTSQEQLTALLRASLVEGCRFGCHGNSTRLSGVGFGNGVVTHAPATGSSRTGCSESTTTGRRLRFPFGSGTSAQTRSPRPISMTRDCNVIFLYQAQRGLSRRPTTPEMAGVLFGRPYGVIHYRQALPLLWRGQVSLNQPDAERQPSHSIAPVSNMCGSEANREMFGQFHSC